MPARKVAVREPTCTGDGVTEAGRGGVTPLLHHLPPLALKRAGYPCTAECSESLSKPHTQTVFEHGIFLTSVESSNHAATPHAAKVMYRY